MTRRHFDKRFAELVAQIPEDEYDVGKLFELFRTYSASVAPDYGIEYIYIQMLAPGPDHSSMQQSLASDIYRSGYPGECDEKMYHFSIGNGGYADVYVGVRKGVVWTPEQQQDITTFIKTQYLFNGRVEAMRQLDRVMFTDQITHVLNQAGLYKSMGAKMASGGLAGYCSNFINIRNMKLFNEKYTEQGGNALLMGFAQRIARYIGDDGAFARLGGDNFLALIESSREEALISFLGNLWVDLTDRSGSTTKVKMEVRAGYYHAGPGDQVSDVMNNASIALQFARRDVNEPIKEFHNNMKTQFFRIKQLEENVPAALGREEFVVYYQPKADISDREHFVLCGAEALVRWMQDGNLIPPMQFIPALEKNGLVAQLDFYVLEHVCRDIKAWKEAGLQPVPVSVNFSRRHLKNENIVENIMAVVNRYGIEPSLLEIEITESYDIDDMDVLSRFERKMHEYGIKVAVDDFGSGFSSIRLIKNIVTDTIKLDKSIVDGIGEDREDDIIISHIIHMVRALGKEVLAEGVEKTEQADFLRENNCNTIQGYLYAKPMPREAFEESLKNRS